MDKQPSGWFLKYFSGLAIGSAYIFLFHAVREWALTLVSYSQILGRRALIDRVKVIVDIPFPRDDDRIWRLVPELTSVFLNQYWYKMSQYPLFFKPFCLLNCNSSHLLGGDFIKIHGMIKAVLPISWRRVIVFPTMMPLTPKQKRKRKI